MDHALTFHWMVIDTRLLTVSEGEQQVVEKLEEEKAVEIATFAKRNTHCTAFGNVT
jgi:hypothetical protein